MRAMEPARFFNFHFNLLQFCEVHYFVPPVLSDWAVETIREKGNKENKDGVTNLGELGPRSTTSWGVSQAPRRPV